MPSRAVGDFELSVLIVVSQVADEAYGLRIRQALGVLRRREYSVGAVYTALRRLEDKGLIESWSTEPLPVRGGRSRREYRLTRAGRDAIRDARRMASRLFDLQPRVST